MRSEKEIPATYAELKLVAGLRDEVEIDGSARDAVGEFTLPPALKSHGALAPVAAGQGRESEKKITAIHGF
jgi:hypothetical protein